MSSTSKDDSKEETKKICPQCDGAGQEDSGTTPFVCRKCCGTGSVPAMRRVAAVMCGGEALEKTAQGTLDEDAPEWGQNDEADNDFSGKGYDSIAMVSASTSEEEIRLTITSLLNSLSQASMEKLLESVVTILGSSMEEIRRTVSTKDGLDEHKIAEYIYISIDGMNRQQLCAMLGEVRRFR